MVIIKEVKEYSNRQRINITNQDKLKPGDKVVLLPEDKYNILLDKYNKSLVELEQYKSRNEDIKSILEVNTKTISDEYKKLIDEKEKELKSKDNELNNLKAIVSKFMTTFNGLSTLDIILRKKHRKLINDLEDSIWTKLNPDRVSSEVNQISDKHKK